ncbi:DNA helicase Rep [Candidatus Albibeggiatoa sp. nov. NOAA]|uniref:DNA helicase Rep n=1 Tax=Candidatus Albibeggiatoa sp. nov. NOAA TaxID=3162724 RepID=UPI0032F171F1|nr:DNA helicase Rep [Thiotrichaceae bacterium]
MIDKLNSRQQQAIKIINTPVLVLAGAGSGKTRVITHKIAWLIQQAQMQPQHIAAVTFTNKAAREMKQRVGQLLKGSNAKGLRVSTFHNLGLNILRQEARTLGFKSNITIFDAQDSLSLLKDLTKRQNDIDQKILNSMQVKISLWKNGLVTPEQAVRLSSDDKELHAAKVYKHYQKQLKAYNAVDFDDLILLPVLLFQQHPDVLQKWQSKIRYLLVDEYQDTNGCQYQLVKLLVGGRAGLTVVGDDDQSIYAWRGAQPENMLLLKQDFPDLQVVKLEQNYRSSNRILQAANSVIANNPHVFDKKLWSDKGLGDELRVVATRGAEHEAEKVASELMNHKFRHRTQYEDYAILYRSNHQARLFETELRNRQIPYYLSGGTSFFSRSEIKDIMAYLRLLVNQDDDNAFLRIANVPRREIGMTTLHKLGEYAQQRHIGLYAASLELGLANQLSTRAAQNLQRFSHWIGQLAARATYESPTTLIKSLMNTVKYEEWLQETCKDKRTATMRMDNVNELIEWLNRLHEQEQKNLPELVAHIVLLDVLDRQNEESNKEGVALMTLHAAKGLEFPHVYLVGMEEELLPHHGSMDEAGIQEERRLAYVGITRAQRSLVMTYAEQRKKFRDWVNTEPSRFLEEIPEDILQWNHHKSKPKTNPKEAKKLGNAHLAHLRDMLKK